MDSTQRMILDIDSNSDRAMKKYECYNTAQQTDRQNQQSYSKVDDNTRAAKKAWQYPELLSFFIFYDFPFVSYDCMLSEHEYGMCPFLD